MDLTVPRLRAVIFDWGGTLTPWHTFDLAEQWQFWEPHTITDEQVRPVWEGLRERGIRVGVLSNTIWPGDYHRGVFERDGVLDLIDVLDIVDGWQSR